MSQKKIISILLSFSKTELNAFEEYVSSPFFNKNTIYIKLLSALKNQIIKYQKSQNKQFILNKNKLIQDVFSNKKEGKTSYIRVAFYHLNKLAEEFIIHQKFQEHGKEYKEHLLLEGLQSRNLEEYFIEVTERIQGNYDEKLPFHYYNCYMFERLTYNFDISKNTKKFESSTQNMLYYLDIYTTLEKLNCWLSLINRFNLEKSDEQKNEVISSLKEYLQYIKNQKYFEVKSIKIYYTALQLLLNWNNEEGVNTDIYFQTLQNYILEKKQVLPKKDSRSIFQIINNYCAIKIIKGNFDYVILLWKQYEIMLQLQLFFAGKYILPKTFKNIVTIGLMSGKIEEIEKFIDENIKKVPNKVRKYVEYFSRANLNFHKKEYEIAEGFLRKMTRRTARIDVSYVLGLRVLELKLYFEWENYSDFDEEFEKRATAFESLLKKGAISTRNTKDYLTFIENIGTIFEMKHYTQKRKEKQEILNNLLKKIRNPKSHVIERKWLIESIEGLL